LHNGAQRIAFDSHNGLGLCKIKYFAAQYPTPHDCCVRFAAVVTGDHATLARGRLATALPSPDFHRLESASFAWRTVTTFYTYLHLTPSWPPPGRQAWQSPSSADCRNDRHDRSDFVCLESDPFHPNVSSPKTPEVDRRIRFEFQASCRSKGFPLDEVSPRPVGRRASFATGARCTSGPRSSSSQAPMLSMWAVATRAWRVFRPLPQGR
jgi:hypothetical protein